MMDKKEYSRKIIDYTVLAIIALIIFAVINRWVFNG